jgi:outer membrane assembly lipoprotein YfiO
LSFRIENPIKPKRFPNLLLLLIASSSCCFCQTVNIAGVYPKPFPDAAERSLERSQAGTTQRTTIHPVRIDPRSVEQADRLFQDAQYPEAYFAYMNLSRSRAQEVDLPYVAFQRGLCLMKQAEVEGAGRHYIESAQVEFESLLSEFSESGYAERARSEIAACQELLEKMDMALADYYMGKGEYRAAIGRYLYVTDNFPKGGHYSEALSRLKECEDRVRLPARPGRLFSVQVGAFVNKPNADTFLASLREKGYEAYIFRFLDAKGKAWFSIRLADCATLEEAVQAASKYKEKERKAAIIKRTKTN